MRVTFTADAQLESIGRKEGPRFAAGSTHDLPEDQAGRWIKRGVAKVAEAAKPEPVVKPEPAPTSSIREEPPAQPQHRGNR